MTTEEMQIRLIEARRKRGLKRDELAWMIDVSEGWIRMVETEHRPFTHPKLVARLFSELGIRDRELIRLFVNPTRYRDAKMPVIRRMHSRNVEDYRQAKELGLVASIGTDSAGTEEEDALWELLGYTYMSRVRINKPVFKALIRNAGLTHRDFCNRLGVNDEMVTMTLKTGDMTKKMARKVLDYFEIDPKELILTWDGQKYRDGGE